MDILIPIRDLLSRGTAEARYYRLVASQNPGIRFHWTSRGPDLRLARAGALPPNAKPFAVDAPNAVSALASRALGFHAEHAAPLFASLLAWQGAHFDAVEVPSTVPVAHLVRPAAELFAVTVGIVAQSWLGSASDMARLVWPDAAGPTELEQLGRLEAHSDSAIEMRIAVGGLSPPCSNGAPRCALALAASPGRADGHAASPSGGLFAPASPFEVSLGPFLSLVAMLPEGLRRRARLPRELPADLRRALAADPVGSEIPRLAPGETALVVDCTPLPVFDPVLLEGLPHGGRAILHRRSWTAEALDQLSPATAPHGIDFDGPVAVAEFAAALDAPPAVTIPEGNLGGRSLGAIYAEAGALPLRLAPVAVKVEIDDRARYELEASFPAPGRYAEPQVSFIVSGGEGTLRAIAATLASLARLIDLPSEVIVVADETVTDTEGLSSVVGAAGRHARVLYAGRNAGLLPVLKEARAPLVAFLGAGDRVAPRFGRWALDALADDVHVVAVPPWAALRFARPGPVRAAMTPAGLSPGPAIVFRREVIAELGGALGRTGIRDAVRRVARRHGLGAIHAGRETMPLAFSEDASAYAG